MLCFTISIKAPKSSISFKNIGSPVLEGQTYNVIFKISGYFHTTNHPVYFQRSSVSYSLS